MKFLTMQDVYMDHVLNLKYKFPDCRILPVQTDHMLIISMHSVDITYTGV
jgi:hypothetical protein